MIQTLGYRPLADRRDRIKWLILLRWLAVAILFAVITVTHFAAGLVLQIRYLYTGNAALLVSNIAYTVVLQKTQLRRTNIFINVQITLDLLLLTYLLIFSGGIANPFFLCFIFHMVIASILLSNRAAYIQATLGVCMFSLLITGELWNLIPTDPFSSHLFPQAGRADTVYLVGLSAAFVAAIYITVYMATSIVNTLRRREGELQAMVGKLETANSALELKDREKSRYVLTVTHDIKGSLSSIQSCLRVVLDGLLGAVALGVKDMVGRAERRSLSLLRYVNELLYLSTLRTETGISHQEIVLGEIVNRVAEELSPRAVEKGIALTVTDDTAGASFRVDPYGIEELCKQLLDNAVKYTLKGGKIALTVGMDVDIGSLQFSVVDTGIGIGEKDLSHVYEDFFSADIPENREVPSTGLGLAIAKQIVTMHRGTIEVESTLGRGSTFRCTIPSGNDIIEGGVVG
jgi:signal transduction histidine kinase